MTLVFFIQYLAFKSRNTYLFICLRYNKYTKIIQNIQCSDQKNLTRSYIEIHVTIISLVDSD